jgi:hypothetical protein
MSSELLDARRVGRSARNMRRPVDEVGDELI